MRLRLCRLRFPGHAGPSGYDRLADHLEDAGIDRGPDLRIRRRRPPRWWRRGPVGWGPAIRDVLANRVGLRRGLARLRPDDLLHVLYFEDCLKALGRRGHGRLHGAVATLHHPGRERLGRRGFLRALSRLRAVVVLSESERRLLEQVLPGRVHRIPHGVDTSYFRPESGSAAAARPPRVMVCGRWQRDWEGLAATIREVRRRDPAITWDLVVPDGVLADPDAPGVRHHRDLADRELLALYRRATVFVHPVRAAVANNALLEALSCGVPAVAHDVGGVRDYAGRDASVLVPRGHSGAMADNVVRICGDPALASRMGRAARTLCEKEFAWPVVAARMRELYAALGVTGDGGASRSREG